jgi:hypothetical protein
MNIQYFDKLVMGYATPILDKMNNFVKQTQNKFSEQKEMFSELGALAAKKVGFAPVSDAAVTALTVAPITLLLFASLSSLVTPTLILVGLSSAAVVATQKNLFSKEGKLSMVASFLSANVLYTAVKVMTALASLDIGAALLALTVGVGASVSLYAAYKWLSERAQTPKQPAPYSEKIAVL